MSDLWFDQLQAQAQAHFQAGRPAQAIQVYREILDVHAARLHLAPAHPGLVVAANNLAILYRTAGHAELARDMLRDLVARVPGVPEAWFNLGNALLKTHDYAAAVDAYETALRLRPDYPKALTQLGQASRLTLRQDRYLDLLRQAAQRDGAVHAHSLLLFFGMFSPDISAEALASLADQWDARFAAPFRTDPVRFEMSRDPERPLRVGYVSPNFCNHSIGVMFEPILAGHDRARFLSFCYGDVGTPDDATERFRAMAHQYRDTTRLTDDQLTQLIRDDRVDVLVDLNLHMPGSRLGVFARRAAPVQINYLAYPFTCGLRTMDYRVTDAVLEPAGQPVLGPEMPLRLRSSYWLYRPKPYAPDPERILPARSTGRFTFACRNAPQKLNPAVAHAWAHILNRVPEARLQLVADHPLAQEAAIARLFSAAGLDPARIDLVSGTPYQQYLSGYLSADLCLDPFPYGGQTTTLDALWMGIPVLTLAGQASYTRGAASILPRVELGELITHTIEEYQDVAVALAGNLERLEALRDDLRGRMRASVLCDERGFVADFERGLRLAWQRDCQGKPPAAIDLTEPQP